MAEKAATKEIIEQSIKEVSEKIRITRGGCVFNYGQHGSLISCNGVGAVLLKHNLQKSYLGDWLKEICILLNVNGIWVWRFVQGFDYGNILKLYDIKDNQMIFVCEDDVSRWANSLARKVCTK